MAYGNAVKLLYEVMKICTYAYAIAFLLLLVGACKKVELPEPIEEEPVFFSELRLGDQRLNLAAGQNDYELVTRYAKSDQNVLTFAGVFKRKDCPSLRCAKSLRFVIRDIQLYDAGNFNVDQSIKPSNIYGFNWAHHRDSLHVRFQVDSIFRRGYQLKWRFMNNTQDQTNANLLNVQLDRSVEYQVALHAVRGNLRSSQLQTIDLEEGGCSAIIQTQEKNRLAVKARGKEPFTYRWKNLRDTSRVIAVNLQPNDVREYEVTVTDARGCQSVAAISSHVLGVATSVDHNRSVGFELAGREHISNRDKLALQRVTVEYLNQDLKSFSSHKFSQPDRASFEIMSVTDFQDDELGQKTKKIQAKLSCLLYGQNVNDVIPLEGTVTFAVAYPD